MDERTRFLAMRTALKMVNAGLNPFERIVRLRREFGFDLTAAKEIDAAAQTGRPLTEAQQELADELEQDIYRFGS